jgi:LytS/YehU family sensor histidine kinase
VIESSYSDKTLVIKVINSGELKYEPVESGIGISNTKKRLAILFGANGHFQIEQNGEFVISTITITYK